MRQYVLLCCFLIFAGCAAQQPQIAIRPVEKEAPQPPPHPLAVTHFLQAKLAEANGMRTHAVEELRAAVMYDTTSATLYGTLAEHLNHTGNFSEAIVPALRAVRLKPGDTEHRWQLFHALIRGERDTAAALSQLETIASLDAHPLGAYDQMLQIYSARQQDKQVIDILDRIVALPGLGTRERLIAAQNFSRFGEHKRAQANIQRVIDHEPDNYDAWLDLGINQFSQRDTLTAVRTFRRALSRQQFLITHQNARIWGQLVRIYRTEPHLQHLLSETPLDTAMVSGMGQVFLDMARDAGVEQAERIAFYRLSETIFDGILHADPQRETALAAKAHILLETDRPQEARAYFHQAHLQSEKVEYYMGTVHTYMAEGDWANALMRLEQLHAAAPPNARQYPQIVSDLARTYMRVGESARAREVYQRAAQALPDQSMYRYELARIYLSEKAWGDAIPLLEPIPDETENNPDLLQSVLFDLGHAYERAAHIPKAIEAFQRLLNLQPDHPGANNYMGYMLAERGERLLEAKAMIERALKTEPENGAYLDSMGWVYYQLGNYAEAMKYLVKALVIEEEALNRAGDNPRVLESLYENLAIIHEHAGDTARALGDLARARKHYERALEFDPKNQTLRDKIKNLSASPSTSKAP